MIKFEENKIHHIEQGESKYKQNQQELKNLSAIISLTSLSQNSRILDVGCGAGRAFPELLSYKPSKLVGVDVCKKAMEMASAEFRDSRIQLIHSDFYDMVDNEFDVAFIYNSYVDFTNKVLFAKKIHDVLSKYGRFMIAFNQSRESINHQNNNRKTLRATELYSVHREAIIFSEWFHIDIMVDTAELYILSGIKTF